MCDDITITVFYSNLCVYDESTHTHSTQHILSLKVVLKLLVIQHTWVKTMEHYCTVLLEWEAVGALSCRHLSGSGAWES